jgi:hypothetical protein
MCHAVSSQAALKKSATSVTLQAAAQSARRLRRNFNGVRVRSNMLGGRSVP